jgi:superfamily II DNA or RNA helicase
MIRKLESGIQIFRNNDTGRMCLVLTDDLRKSFSSDLQKKYPGGRWITVSEGPLAGRHIYILGHHDGTASVLVGGGPAMRHKLLSVKKDESAAKEEAKPEEGKEGEEPKPEEKPEEKPEPKKPELTEADRVTAEDSIKLLSKEITDQKSELYKYIQEKWGIQRDLTPEEEKKVEARTADIADPVQKGVQKQIERQKVVRDKEKQAIHDIIKSAKGALLDENPSSQGDKGIAAVVKENAEELIQMHLAIQALAKERKDIRKMVHVGKLNDKFRTGHEILASFTPLTSDEIKKTVMDEKALDAELKAHYTLMRLTRGIEGQDAAKGDTTTTRAIKQGGFETVTGFVGQLTGKAVISKKVYDELGSDNAGILASHYLKAAGHNMSKVAKDLEGYLTGESNPVAFHANERGAYFMGLADKVRQFGAGADNIMTSRQAMGTALKYMSKAYESYGQAEGALNQGAELLYALKGKRADGIEFHSKYTDSLERKRQNLGLKPKDVTMKKAKGGGFTMVIPPKSFDKMLHEKETEAHGQGLGLEHSAADIKNFKANTDDFFPTGINSYTPPDKNGVREKLTIDPIKQAAVRLLAKQKKIALDFEAGTGKSFTTLIAKAHLDDLHGKKHRMMVSMPAKLLANFAEEVTKFTNYKVAIVNDQSDAVKAKLYASDPDTIVLVNKEKFNFDLKHMRKNKFDIVVADEAHKITQREGREKSEMSKGLEEIAGGASHYIAMSGTLAPNDLSELYAHAHIMDPKKFSSQKEFMAQFGSIHKGVGYKEQVRNFMLTYLGDNIMSARKQDRPYQFKLHSHDVALHPEQKAEYKKISDSYRDKDIVTFQRDQQYNSVLNAFDHTKNPKFAKAKELIDQHLKTKGDDEKILFYAKNRETVGQINEFLKTHYPQYNHVEFTGTTKKSELDSNKKAFTTDPKMKFSIHMRAGVEGLNLQHTKDRAGATMAIAIASGEDSYAPLDQFFSRADRTGADRDIDAHIILTNTPHDIGTQVRLDEKKAVGQILDANVRKSPAAMAKALGLFLLRRHSS